MQPYGPRRTDLYVRPRDLTEDPWNWLDSRPLHLSAEYAQEFARRLDAARGTRSTRVVAAQSGLAKTNIADALAGRSWPDFRTVARIEFALGVCLWPGTDFLLRDLRRKRAALAERPPLA